MRKLSIGKIPIDVLDRTVLRLTGYPSKEVLTGPKAGVDFAAVRIGGGYLIVSSDPITGVSSGVGRYAVAVSANDIATSGNAPQFMESVILLPEDSTPENLRGVAAEMDAAAKKLKISLVGGHTEITPGLKRPIIVVTAFSFVRSFVSSEMARKGDVILMTKTAGIEGTAALVREARGMRRRLPRQLAARAASFEDRFSVVPEATTAFRTGRVHAMHDCTEGGLLGAAYEMSLASGIGFELNEDAVPVAPTTRQVCEKFAVDPLRLIGSGALLIAAREEDANRVCREVGKVAGVTRVGRFTAAKRLLLKSDGSEIEVGAAPEDELWRALGVAR